MGDLLKPPFSKERRFPSPTPSQARRMTLGGTFALVLWFFVFVGIPPVQGAFSLYLPLILKPPICDPVLTLTTGDTQILFGTPGKDHVCEYGFGNNVSQYAGGGAGNDTIFQDCRGAETCWQTASLGDGNDAVTQYGGKGNCSMYADGGAGIQVFNQIGGPGDDTITVHAGTGNSRITQIAGSGNDILEITGSQGDDIVTINAGEGNDTIVYNNTSGLDLVHVEGGPGDDKLTVIKNQQDVTILGGTGTIICKSGNGGTTITVVNVEHITLVGDAGTPICQWDAP
jgi:Ca2+-binding RTX toxin-like protein